MTELAKQIESLQRKLDEETKERVNVEELLSIAEAATDKIREKLCESEEVLNIPSHDLSLTKKELGSGSYGGEI